MDNKLNTIIKEAISIQVALLKFRNEHGPHSMQVKIAFTRDNFLHCIIPDEVPLEMKTGDKNVHLIQKHGGNYFFISGHISDELERTPGIVSIAITKATWFVRKSRGSLSWLRKKYTYESEDGIMNIAS